MTLVPPSPDFQFITDTEPSNAKKSDWWLDTSASPPVAKVYDGSNFVKPQSIDFIDQRLSNVKSTSLIDYAERFTGGDGSLESGARTINTIPSPLTSGTERRIRQQGGLYRRSAPPGLALQTEGIELPRNWLHEHPRDANGEIKFNFRFHIPEDGNYLFGNRQNRNSLHRYDFGTAWDLSTLSTSPSQTYDFASGVAGTYEGIAVGDNGKYAVVADSNDDVLDIFEMSNPYDLSSMSHLGSQNLNYLDPKALAFSKNGYKLFSAGTNNNSNGRVRVDSLDTPYNLDSNTNADTFQLDKKNYNPNKQIDFIFFTNDGEYMWWGRNIRIDVAKLNIPYDLSEGYQYLGYSEMPRAYRFHSPQYREADGRLYLHTDHHGYPRAHPSAFDLSPSIMEEEAIVGLDDSTDRSAGEVGITTTANNGSVTVDAVEPTPEVTTGYGKPSADEGILNPPNRLDVTAEVDNAIGGVAYNDDGSKLYVLSRDSNNTNSPFLYSYTLSTAYDPSSGSLTNSVDLSANQDRYGGDLEWGADGTQLFISDRLVNSTSPNQSRIYEYSLSTAYDISTLSYVQEIHASDLGSVNGDFGGNSLSGFSFAGGGSHLYITAQFRDGEGIYHYTLGADYDITTTAYSGYKEIAQTLAPYERSDKWQYQIAPPDAVDVSEDGKRLVYAEGTSTVGEMWLEDAYDITSARWKGNDRVVISVDDGSNNVRTRPRTIRIAPDGDLVVSDFQIGTNESVMKIPSHNQFGILPYYPTAASNLSDGDDLDSLGVPSDAKFRVTLERSDATDSPSLDVLEKRREI